jgi:hypothetical protein
MVRVNDGVATRRAVTTFIGIWFLAAAVNMWIGIVQAGYSFAEEFVIFLVIFLLPAAAALVIQRKS